MNDIQFFDDVHNFIHIYARWCAVFRDKMPLDHYLAECEPERWRRLFHIYALLEEMYAD